MRLLPDVPLPPYTHVPGRTPHPISDPRGHSHGIPADIPDPIDPEHWQASRAYLHGFDLFNAGFYWEAHEVWEGLWHAAGRKGTTADFLKALIKLAAAGVKHLEGMPDGVKSHACRAAVVFREMESQRFFLGIMLREVGALADAMCERGWPEQPPILLPRMQSGAR